MDERSRPSDLAHNLSCDPGILAFSFAWIPNDIGAASCEEISTILLSWWIIFRKLPHCIQKLTIVNCNLTSVDHLFPFLYMLMARNAIALLVNLNFCLCLSRFYCSRTCLCRGSKCLPGHSPKRAEEPWRWLQLVQKLPRWRLEVSSLKRCALLQLQVT